jgi:hypothetical protein
MALACSADWASLGRQYDTGMTAAWLAPPVSEGGKGIAANPAMSDALGLQCLRGGLVVRAVREREPVRRHQAATMTVPAQLGSASNHPLLIV